MPRPLSSIEYEGARAMLSLAGLRLISQSLVTGGAAGSDNTYTVTGPNTRRVVMYVNHATNVVRFNVNAAATASHLPIKNQTYFVVDAKKNDVLHFFDTTGGTPVHFVEVD
jgi:hypothetical protein